MPKMARRGGVSAAWKIKFFTLSVDNLDLLEFKINPDWLHTRSISELVAGMQ